MSLKPYQERVVQEKAELDDKIAKLSSFITSDQFASLPTLERNLLWSQRISMREYSDILSMRIDAFKAEQ